MSVTLERVLITRILNHIFKHDGLSQLFISYVRRSSCISTDKQVWLSSGYDIWQLLIMRCISFVCIFTEHRLPFVHLWNIRYEYQLL